MKHIVAAALSLSMTFGAAQAQTMEISPNGSQESVSGAPENFTGTVTVTPLFPASNHSNASGSLVEFTPSARSAWHTHPAGQTLIIKSGIGWVQQEGGEKTAIRPGDVIWTPPGVKHWHGAQGASSMAHIAISPSVEGSNVTWLELVTDAQYAD